MIYSQSEVVFLPNLQNLETKTRTFLSMVCEYWAMSLTTFLHKIARTPNGCDENWIGCIYFRFTVYLQHGPHHEPRDIAVCVDARFAYNNDRSVVVRNSCQHGAWGSEERHCPYFPFMQNASFDMMILVEPGQFKVYKHEKWILPNSSSSILCSLIFISLQNECFQGYTGICLSVCLSIPVCHIQSTR